MPDWNGVARRRHGAIISWMPQRFRLVRPLRIALLTAALLVVADTAWAQKSYPFQRPAPPPPNLSPPRVLRYDFERDEIHHAHSVVAPRPTDGPGGEIAYYGNRLTQSRYIGSPSGGGMYEAIDDFARQRALDARKYRYHWLRRMP